MKRLIGEFEEQSYTQIIFPHQNTDWAKYLKEAQECFVNIINAIRKFQTCLVVSYDIKEVQKHFHDTTNLLFKEYISDDTWARDCSAISIENNKQVQLLNFTFNAWGGKFEAFKDNAMTSFLTPQAKKIDFVLEGGAIESNGENILLTTKHCMLNPNRNPTLTQEQITQKLQNFFGVKEVLYLQHGYLAGDDTDSHIDTLARFINKNTLMYVQCKDKTDEHFKELSLMEKELKHFAKIYHLSLIALPMPSAIFYEKERLPATYANFLFVNGGILVPIYGVKEDNKALEIFTKTFPQRKIIAIDCSILIREHGSLHCISMNFA
jgi:agmatine/peptidylarginine deiminase